jgi:hypothetical protein
MLKSFDNLDSKGAILVNKTEMNSSDFSFDLKRFTPGMYFLKIQNSSGLKTIRVTKN